MQSLQPVAEQQIDNVGKDDEIKRYHIPAHEQRIGNAETNGCDLGQFAVSQPGLYAEGERAIGQVEERHVLFVGPSTPLAIGAPDFLATQFVAILGFARERYIVEGIEEMQMALVTIYLLQLLGHIAIATPKHAVATHHDGTETDAATVGECGQVLLVGVDDDKYLVTAYPYLSAVTILSLHIDATDRHEQMGGQVGNGVARFAGIRASGFPMNIPEPETAMGILADFRHQREVVNFLTINHFVHRITVDTVGFAGIDIVAIHQQGSCGVGGQPADTTAPSYLVDTTRCGGKQYVTALAQHPTDIVDVGHTTALLGDDAIKTIGASHVDLVIKSRDGMYLTRETIFGQKVTVDRRNLKREDAMRRGTPKHAMTVVSHIGYLVGTQTVILSDGIKVVAMVIGDNQTTVLLNLDLLSAV